MKFKIKYLVYSLFIISIAFWFGGCAYTLSPVQGLLYTNVDKPVTYNSAKQNMSYEVIGEVEGRASATSILGIIASGNAGIQVAYEKAYSQIPGTEGLIDVSIDQNFNSFLGLFASTTTILRAKAVKWIIKEKTVSIQSKVDSTYSSYTSPLLASSTTQPSINLGKITPFFTQGDLNHNVNISLSNLAGEPGGVGFRLGYKMRRTGLKFTFNPAISIGSVKKEETFSYSDYEYNSQTGRYGYITKKIKEKISYSVVPIELNFSVNSELFNEIISSLPSELKPYAEAGLVYYIWKASGKYEGADTYYGNNSWDRDWDFFEMGLDFGLGVEYYIKPNLAIQGGLKRYIVFDKDFDFWNYQVGITFSPK